VESETGKELLCEVHHSAEMGKDSIVALLPKVSNEQLRLDMMTQLDGYLHFSARAGSELSLCHAKPKSEKKSKKFAASMGIAAETMFDSSASHIAELITKGSSADIMTITRAVNKAKGRGGEIIPNADAFSMCNELVSFENSNIERMKKYL